MISVIIPTLDEAANLPQLLSTLTAEIDDKEIILVDGGSRDGTVALARAHGVTVVKTEPCRGAQLRLGAQAARGELLLFLHADSVFPPGGLSRIRETLTAAPNYVEGNFRLLFDGEDRFSRWLTGFYAWMRRHDLYYGDSAVFVRRTVYDELGGIRPLALMEDFDFTRRLERFGETCSIEDPPLVTSSRRFVGRHPVGIFVGWLVVHALYYLRSPTERLAGLYYGRRS